MSDVFVSYKAEDRARVEPLVERLEAEGLSVWWDARVSGGEAWREAIADHLDAARCVIVVWSKRSTGPEGRFVRDEATRAQRREVYLPVTIDKVDPPLGFGETQALQLTSWKGDDSDPRYRAISTCVHSMLGLVLVHLDGRELDARRELVRALQLKPVADADELFSPLLVIRALGFDLATTAAAIRAIPPGEKPTGRLAKPIAFALLFVEPPYRDPKRALELFQVGEGMDPFAMMGVLHARFGMGEDRAELARAFADIADSLPFEYHG